MNEQQRWLLDLISDYEVDIYVPKDLLDEFVDGPVWAAINRYIDNKLRVMLDLLLVETDMELIQRTQGAIVVLRDLKALPERLVQNYEERDGEEDAD